MHALTLDTKPFARHGSGKRLDIVAKHMCALDLPAHVVVAEDRATKGAQQREGDRLFGVIAHGRLRQAARDDRKPASGVGHRRPGEMRLGFDVEFLANRVVWSKFQLSLDHIKTRITQACLASNVRWKQHTEAMIEHAVLN